MLATTTLLGGSSKKCVTPFESVTLISPSFCKFELSAAFILKPIIPINSRTMIWIAISFLPSSIISPQLFLTLTAKSIIATIEKNETKFSADVSFSSGIE